MLTANTKAPQRGSKQSVPRMASPSTLPSMRCCGQKRCSAPTVAFHIGLPLR